MKRKLRILLFPAAAVAMLLLACSLLSAQPADSGFLKVKVHPGDAGVFVDGKYLGPAAGLFGARKYAVAAGEHELVLLDPRYLGYWGTVKIEKGKTATVSESLVPREPSTPPYGTLRVAGFDTYSPVFINGHYVGYAGELDGLWQGLLLNPGEYDVKVCSKSGDTLLEKRIRIFKGETLKLRPE